MRFQGLMGRHPWLSARRIGSHDKVERSCGSPRWLVARFITLLPHAGTEEPGALEASGCKVVVEPGELVSTAAINSVCRAIPHQPLSVRFGVCDWARRLNKETLSLRKYCTVHAFLCDGSEVGKQQRT